MPACPPTTPPMATRMPVSTASSSPVLAKFIGMRLDPLAAPRRCSGWGSGTDNNMVLVLPDSQCLE